MVRGRWSRQITTPFKFLQKKNAPRWVTYSAARRFPSESEGAAQGNRERGGEKPRLILLRATIQTGM